MIEMPVSKVGIMLCLNIDLIVIKQTRSQHIIIDDINSGLNIPLIYGGIPPTNAFLSRKMISKQR